MTPAQIVMRPVDALIPFERNARTHSPEQVEQLVASIQNFGFTNPILISPDGIVVAGHGRLDAARAAGLEEVPTLTVGEDWTEEQLRAYVLADNQLALNAGWDDGLLALELGELTAAGFDTNSIGWTAEEIDGLIGQPNFEPGNQSSQSSLDRLEPKLVICPHCGKEHDIRAHET